MHWGVPLSPTAVFLVPVRACQLSVSRGKESLPGNRWLDSLYLGRRESLLAPGEPAPTRMLFPLESPPLCPPHPWVPEALSDHHRPWPCLQFPAPSPTADALEVHSGSTWSRSPPKADHLDLINSIQGWAHPGQDIQGATQAPWLSQRSQA